jgi:hypothetical protein
VVEEDDHINKMTTPQNGVEDQQQERRSARLKKEIIMTTQEKNDIMAKKRNLEGNTSSKFTISELSHNSMHDMSKKMGVIVDNSTSNSFDLLKEIENARLNLFNEQQKAKTNVQITEVSMENECSEQLQLEWCNTFGVMVTKTSHVIICISKHSCFSQL